jgi:hypothetical protein
MLQPGGLQIRQTPGSVTILYENHAFRVIPKDLRSHIAANVKLWMATRAAAGGKYPRGRRDDIYRMDRA